MNVYINRTLNLKKIKYIGLDMDHTLIRYHSRNFEALAYESIIDRLVGINGYPNEIRKLKFNYDLAIRGLVLDLENGNLLKVNRYSAIRAATHGTHRMDYATQQAKYKSTYIDLGEPNLSCIDTHFAISYATLFAQLVDMKDSKKHQELPEYPKIARDVLHALDSCHRDGTLKEAVQKNLDHYIVRDEALVRGLETFSKHEKRLFLLTNSDFAYTRSLLDYAISPYLKSHSSWTDLFEIIITQAQKPRFFYDDLQFLKVNPKDGTMTNHTSKLQPGVFQGGCAKTFTKDLNLAGDEILYIGDHIYGDILRLKKDCNWRTALVVEELGDEIRNNESAKPIQDEINTLMAKKEPLEIELNDLFTRRAEDEGSVDGVHIQDLQNQINKIDFSISSLISRLQVIYNQIWGEVMRTGNEESYFAYQVERFACIYMAKLSDFLALSPRTYLRAKRRLMPHESE